MSKKFSKTILLIVFASFSFSVINPILASDNQPVLMDKAENTIMDKVKKGAIWTKDKAVQALKVIVSPEGQLAIIGAYGIIFAASLLDVSFRSLLLQSKKMDNVPQLFIDIIKKMGVKRNITFFISPKDGPITAAANINKVFVHEDVLALPVKEQEMILGHELTHIMKDHVGKEMLLTYVNMGLSVFVVYGQKVLIEKISQFLKDKFALQYNNKTTKILNAIEKISEYISESPLAYFVLFMILQGKVSQYFEKEADIESATRLDCAQAGVDLNLKWIKEHADLKTTQGIKYWLSPFRIKYFLVDSFFGWQAHPPVEKRINYLQALVAKQ